MASPPKIRLRIEPYGRLIDARPDRTLLDAALAAGLNLPHSCKSGHCSSCRATLREGAVRYPRGTPPGLTAAEAAAGEVLLCQAYAASDALAIEARVVARAGTAEIRTLPCRIERRVRLAADVLQVFLRLPATEAAAFLPGQYLDVLLDGGRRRSFSLACPPHDAALLELHVRRVAGGGFTAKLFDELADGALLRIELPIGQFVYRDSAAPMLAIAGGTGWAPLKSMLRHIFERGPARDVHLFWGARSAADLYEDALLREWTARYARLRYTPVLSHADPARDPAAARYEHGWVHAAVLRHYPDLAPFEVYAAGPPEMIAAIRAQFPAAGLAADRLFFDSFDYAPR
ncbi:MAG: 2Fe-2S iron-sulfur cluster-binding protein [Steroidobacteraceae bacterium]|nr:2Fe-2S iron-sulfur cluster-binding protein [Steroidobacteraceae bacterium]MDW8258959.1 2Fe-2S iron-sulfur cluster-binding protein [Gammaproteobacteria bacterium]